MGEVGRIGASVGGRRRRGTTGIFVDRRARRRGRTSEIGAASTSVLVASARTTAVVDIVSENPPPPRARRALAAGTTVRHHCQIPIPLDFFSWTERSVGRRSAKVGPVFVRNHQKYRVVCLMRQETHGARAGSPPPASKRTPPRPSQVWVRPRIRPRPRAMTRRTPGRVRT